MDVAPDSAENVPEPHKKQFVIEIEAKSCEYVPVRPKKYMSITHKNTLEFYIVIFQKHWFILNLRTHTVMAKNSHIYTSQSMKLA